MSRRWRYPQSRRGEFFQGPRTVVPQPPSLVPRVSRARFRFSVAPRRGQFFAGQRLVTVAAPAFIPPLIRQAGEYRLGVRARRGAFRIVPQPVVMLPAVQRGAIHAGVLRVRSGRFASPPLQVVAPSAPLLFPRLVRGRARLAVVRDGRFVAPPLTAIVQQPPSFPPRTVRGRARLAAVRHGVFACPPWSTQAAPPPPWVPSPITGHRRTLTVRRGRFAGCPATSLAPPLHVSSVRPGASPRRGRFTTCPPSPARIPQPVRARRPSCTARRGQYVEPSWPQAVPPPPPALVPMVRRGRAAPPAYRVHGRVWLGWMELTVSPEPDDSGGVMSARDRAGAMAVAGTRPGPSMRGQLRRTSGMEAT